MPLFLWQSCRRVSPDQLGVATQVITADWQFRQAGKDNWLAAQVPGCVHTDLLHNKLISDPFVETRERNLTWIEREEWEYRTVFNINNEIINKDQVRLFFGGLDTFASVYLNDSLVLTAQNMFRGYEVSCKNLLKPGKNTLRIYFKAPVNTVMPAINKLGYRLPAPNDFSPLKAYPFVRKAAYQFGSEVSPRLLTCGIWQPIRLIAYNLLKINDLHIVQHQVTDAKASLTARFEISCERETQAEVFIQNPDSLFRSVQQSVHLQPGTNTVSVDFEMLKPRRWWSNGLGEAFLYKIKGGIRVGGKMADTLTVKTGIRTLEVITKKDKDGEPFTFRLNGQAVFMKGANYLPADIFPTEISTDKYKTIITSVKAANMNMLRVRADGIYENKAFYELCDENGILVWQDFMFATALFPGDSAFIDNVTQEVTYQIKQLRNHPCLAMWCGNDEIETNWYQNRWKQDLSASFQDSLQLLKDYRTLFYKRLPVLVKQFDSRFYLPSSPKYFYQDPNSLNNGIMQFAGVFKESRSLVEFNYYAARFVGKYTFFSFPELNTVWSYLPEAEDWERDSRAIRWHTRLKDGNALMNEYISQYYKIPKGFESYFYVSQLLQAGVVKAAAETHRRHKPYCMGSLYGLLQDNWTGVTPALTDYFGNHKAAWFALKKAYAPVLVSPVEEDKQLKIYVVSDRPVPLHGVLQVTVFDFSGKKWFEESVKIHLPANASQVCFSSDKWQPFLKGKNRRELVLEATVTSGQEVLAENLYYLVPPKLMNLPVSQLDYQVVEKADGFEITVSATRLVKNLYLRCRECRGTYSDNFFDLLPGRRKTVFFRPEKKMRLEECKKQLKVSSLGGI